MWRRAIWRTRRSQDRPPPCFSSSAGARHHEDDGDWSYASEWWGGPGSPAGRTVFSSPSEVGNGVVSVVAYPSSRPAFQCWPEIERWLQDRYAKIHPYDGNGKLNILGYQWRCLRFNDATHQSIGKVMAIYKACGSDPGSVYLMQQPHCLAVPYVKSMVSAGLTTLASLGYDLLSAASGRKELHVLCIGHGGGSLPLFLANKVQGAIVHSVELDPLVVSASIQAMGFPASSLKEPISSTRDMDNVLWRGVHERLFLHNSDADTFIHQNNTNVYDLIFVDAYDGEDIFPFNLWDPDGIFLKALEKQLHPDHGAVVVNLHADLDISTPEVTDYSDVQRSLPMGKYISHVSRAYKEHMGMAFTISVPWLCNITLVACRNHKGGPLSGNRGMILDTLMSRSSFVDYILDLPFHCFHYIERNFTIVD